MTVTVINTINRTHFDAKIEKNRLSVLLAEQYRDLLRTLLNYEQICYELKEREIRVAVDNMLVQMSDYYARIRQAQNNNKR